MKFMTTALDVLLVLVAQTFWKSCHSWSTTGTRIRRLALKTGKSNDSKLYSTPFEADYYESSNPYESILSKISPISCPEGTKVVLGINKYSHDTSICVADASSGNVLFGMSKERLTRKKHDSGNVASLVERSLECLDLDLDAIEKVVMNNHHHRILPFEANKDHMEWESGLRINGGAEDGYDDDYNLFPNIEKVELSHHLAHAYSTATQSPFDNGMVVVMDGMGETYRAMLRGRTDKNYVSDLDFDDIEFLPNDIEQQSAISYFDWREAESVYLFEKKDRTINLRPIFKRFTPENTPPTLYNHGFENMDSIGAVYSRVSSHIFGDWNACGKVMGLAPWVGHTWEDGTMKIRPEIETRLILKGNLQDGTLEIDRSLISGLPYIARSDSELFDSNGNLIPNKRYDFDDDDDAAEGPVAVGKDSGKKIPTKVALDAITLASRMQIDLEACVTDFVRHFQSIHDATNLCIAGGVGLNSVLNGVLSRDVGFEKTFVSPYPGDDGIAVGCCAYGLFGNEYLDSKQTAEKEAQDDDQQPRPNPRRPPIWTKPLSPYLGPSYTESEIREAIDAAGLWLKYEIIRNDQQRILSAAEEIASGGVVAWYTGRSELGPRALGHRSILADPRKKGLVRFINEFVKRRESFRPFAPSVLADHAAEWFELGIPADGANDNANISPYMSLTASVKRRKRKIIPAVTHVDGSSRLQTVTKEADPLYYALIKKFHEITGVPLVLNTSFNTIPGEPIVETPKDAIRSFLCSMGSIELLIMGDYVIQRKSPDVRALLGERNKDNQIVREGALPKRSGAVIFETKYDLEDGATTSNSEIRTRTRAKMPSRPMDNDGDWYDLLDELEGELLAVCDGETTLNQIMEQYTEIDEKQQKISTDEYVKKSQMIMENVIQRLVRLYENTLIGW